MIPFAASYKRYREWFSLLLDGGENHSSPYTDGDSISLADPGGKERARTLIEGELMLNVPVAGGAGMLKRKSASGLQISQHGRWQEVHLGAWRAAYGRTPFFPHLFPEIEKIYREKSEGSLEEFNKALHLLICRWLGMEDGIVATLRTLPSEDRERLRQTGAEKLHMIDRNHSIFEVLFRLGKEGVFTLL